jgi:hypothetical protein
VISKRFQLRLASGESKWSLKDKYDDFGGKCGVSPRQEESLMWSVWWARGVLMMMEDRRVKMRGENRGQGVPTVIEPPIFS